MKLVHVAPALRRSIRTLSLARGGSEQLQRYNADGTGTSALFQTATRETDVADGKCEKPLWPSDCSDVADQKVGNCAFVASEAAPDPDDWAFNLDEDPAQDPVEIPVKVIGEAPPGSSCIYCHCNNDRPVLKIRRADQPGTKTETLHQGCARSWFKAVRS
jgi:hypothetical protein